MSALLLCTKLGKEEQNGEKYDGSLVFDTHIDTKEFESGIGKLKSIAKTGAVAIGAASAAIGAVGAAAIKAYADYEQLVGGVDTLFKDSSKTIQKYADEAYKAAGMSANKYMETVTSFSASLLQSLGGDTAKSVEYANQAVIDMSDNANKMGTNIQSIQDAYQGFAKQNYTMLDNLKLGYGGTKEEMQRLLQDAEKLSGIKYDISSFADITQATRYKTPTEGVGARTAMDRLKSRLLTTCSKANNRWWKNTVNAIQKTDDKKRLFQKI